MGLEVGDQVLVHIKSFGTDHKIADKWENNPYIVKERMTGKPVYKVKPVWDITGTKSYILHRSMLYPIQSVAAVDRICKVHVDARMDLMFSS